MPSKPSATSTCPACGAPLSSQDLFCPACGAPQVRGGSVRGSAAQDFAAPERGAEGRYIGRTVHGRFLITKRIATGGMGEVYLAVHQELGSKVAVKVLSRAASDDESMVKRFVNEARSSCRIAHPYAVVVHDLARLEDGTPYMVMEYVPGLSLTEFLRKHGALPWPLAVRLATQLTEVLGCAHAQRVIHRDIKPDNVMVVEAPGGRYSVKMLDFGIAKILDDEMGAGLTQTGMTFGTPEYMSPEQAQGADVDARSDVYALGALLFAMIAGRPPFENKNKYQLLHQHIHDAPPRLDGVVAGTLPRALADLVERMLAKDPARRPASMEEVQAHLERLRADPDAGRQLATGPEPRASGARHEPPVRRREAPEVVPVPRAAMGRKPAARPEPSLAFDDEGAAQGAFAWEADDDTASDNPERWTARPTGASRRAGASEAFALDAEPTGGHQTWQIAPEWEPVGVGSGPSGGRSWLLWGSAAAAALAVLALLGTLAYAWLRADQEAAPGEPSIASTAASSAEPSAAEGPVGALEAAPQEGGPEDGQPSPSEGTAAMGMIGQEARVRRAWGTLQEGRLEEFRVELEALEAEYAAAPPHDLVRLRAQFTTLVEEDQEIERLLAANDCNRADEIVRGQRERYSRAVSVRHFPGLNACRERRDCLRQGGTNCGRPPQAARPSAPPQPSARPAASPQPTPAAGRPAAAPPAGPPAARPASPAQPTPPAERPSPTPAQPEPRPAQPAPAAERPAAAPARPAQPSPNWRPPPSLFEE